MPGDQEAVARPAVTTTIIPGYLKLPDFHGDPVNHPTESWTRHLELIDNAYKASGINARDEMKKAHIIQGLKGRARQFHDSNPALAHSNYKDLLAELKKKFDKPNLQELLDIGRIVQKPGETVLEFVHRLREAAKAMNSGDDFLLVTKKEALEQATRENKPAAEITVKKEEVVQHEKWKQEFMDCFIFHYS